MLRSTSLLVPLGAYAAMTLGVPLLDGNARGGVFWEHAAVVLVVSGLVGGVVAGVARLARPSRASRS